MFTWTACARCHIGLRRQINQDNFLCNGHIRADVTTAICAIPLCSGTQETLFSVCDGMGGGIHGEEASLIAVKQQQRLTTMEEPSIQRKLMRANEKICALSREHFGAQIGSTAVSLLIAKDTAQFVHIGDSRGYHYYDGTLRQITQDHTVWQSHINAGIVMADTPQTQKFHHQLTQHLGIHPEEMMIEPASSLPIPLVAGDVFLLCSDGLTGMVSHEDICAILRKSDSVQ